MPKIIENLPETILEAANMILMEQDFRDFSIRAVAKKLDISPATIYNYYPSKEKILEALVNNFWQGLLEEIDRETADDKEASAALEKICGLMQRSMNPFLSHWLAAGSAPMPEEHPGRDDILSRKQSFSAELTRHIAAVLQRCGNDTAYAPIYTRLLVICAHYRQLSFAEIADAIRALEK